LSSTFDGFQLLEETFQYQEQLGTRYTITLPLVVGVGWYADVDGFSLRSSTTRKLDSGEAPLRTSGGHLILPVLKKPIRKLKDGA
jgi:hypothetical protein